MSYYRKGSYSAHDLNYHAVRITDSGDVTDEVMMQYLESQDVEQKTMIFESQGNLRLTSVGLRAPDVQSEGWLLVRTHTLNSKKQISQKQHGQDS